MKILIINYSRIGDSILSTALIKHLLDEYPKSQISIVTSSISQDLFKRMPRLENLIVIDKRKYSLHWLDIWKLVINQKWDLTIDLRSSYLSYIIRTKKYKIFKGCNKIPKVEQLKKFLNTTKEITPHIWLNEKDISESKKLLSGNAPYIAVAPFSNWPQKDWSLQKYIDLFQSDFFKEFTILLFGQSRDIRNKELFNRLLNHNKIKVVNLFDKGNLRQLTPIIDECDLFIGSDSALMHLAATTKCKTIGLFGPTNDVVYGPWGAGNISIKSDANNNKNSTGNKYLENISVEEVYKMIRNIVL